MAWSPKIRAYALICSKSSVLSKSSVFTCPHDKTKTSLLKKSTLESSVEKLCFRGLKTPSTCESSPKTEKKICFQQYPDASGRGFRKQTESGKRCWVNGTMNGMEPGVGTFESYIQLTTLRFYRSVNCLDFLWSREGILLVSFLLSKFENRNLNVAASSRGYFLKLFW